MKRHIRIIIGILLGGLVCAIAFVAILTLADGDTWGDGAPIIPRDTLTVGGQIVFHGEGFVAHIAPTSGVAASISPQAIATHEWSYNGRQLAYIDDNTLFLLTINPLSSPIRLTAADQFPVWAPDGRRIAFVVKTDLCILIIATRQQICVPAPNTSGPVWSPDSISIAFDTRDRFHTSLYIVNADGTGQRKIADDVGTPTWAPDSVSIAFAGSLDGQWHSDIYCENLKTAVVTRLTDTSGTESEPVWSADGKQIAFTYKRFQDMRGDNNFNAYQLHVMQSDGTQRRRLTSPSLNVVAVDRFAWAPDSSALLFTIWQNYPQSSAADLYIVRADGNSMAQVSPASEYSMPIWLP